MWRAGIVGLLVLSASSSARADEICKRLRPFEQASFLVNAQGKRTWRWVEIRWTGGSLEGLSIACTSSADEAAKRLCHWLERNSSLEFSHTLPMRILACHGYRFPRPWPTWIAWQARIDMPDVVKAAPNTSRWGIGEVEIGSGETEIVRYQIRPLGADSDFKGIGHFVAPDIP